MESDLDKSKLDGRPGKTYKSMASERGRGAALRVSEESCILFKVVYGGEAGGRCNDLKERQFRFRMVL